MKERKREKERDRKKIKTKPKIPKCRSDKTVNTEKTKTVMDLRVKSTGTAMKIEIFAK